ncbi:ABC transporter substrate-binding protein [Bradyrhizobium sp. 159]|uniref:ABC transporter substrate-binding protein n=1 Tax=Bradyrhizobium sp. 159 TaxID=2782632 RepID=UPI001FF769BF|nr:ABC transporter substrate-binding protein [Bradyrhizobium sp. 159]MCK1618749.1 ABC transporter substrate-binding protein [Bradyrhizobium sp. 159]
MARRSGTGLCEALWPAGSRRRARRKGPQRLRLAAACARSWLIQSNPIHKRVIAEELPQTTRKLGIAPPVVEATTAEELDIAFASAASQHVDAMIVFGDALISRNSMRTTELAAKHRIPPMYLGRQYATGGGLISYSPDFPDFWRRAGGYVDKILKGTKPSDLPVEQPTKFELVINVRTAKALDLTVPPTLLARADKVIE